MSDNPSPVKAKRPSKILGVIVLLISANFAFASISLFNSIGASSRLAGVCTLTTGLLGMLASVMYLAKLKIDERMLLAVLAIVILLGVLALVTASN